MAGKSCYQLNISFSYHILLPYFLIFFCFTPCCVLRSRNPSSALESELLPAPSFRVQVRGICVTLSSVPFPNSLYRCCQWNSFLDSLVLYRSLLLSFFSHIQAGSQDLLWLICYKTFHSTCFSHSQKLSFSFPFPLLWGNVSVWILTSYKDPPQKRLSKPKTFCSSTLYHASISAQDFFCFSSYLKNTAFILKSNLMWLQQLLGLDFSAVWILFSPVRNQESLESKELRWGGSLTGAKWGESSQWL